MKDDRLISLNAAIDALNKKWRTCIIGESLIRDAGDTLKTLPSAQPGQRNARVFQGIVVEYPSISAYPEYEGKPYFSIKYTENGQEFIGYGTYKPEVLSEYLKEYFMSPTQPVEDIRAMCGECDAWNKYKNYPSVCEDTVPRTSVEYICRKNTVSTNPYEHKYHDKFMQFMDDPEISDFGRWQHSNGFNTALVAVKCDLDKVPSVTPKQPGWIPVTERLPERYDNYLITTEDEDTDIGTFHPEFKQWSICDADGFRLTDGVLAWCELPKPWEGGQDGV